MPFPQAKREPGGCSQPFCYTNYQGRNWIPHGLPHMQKSALWKQNPSVPSMMALTAWCECHSGLTLHYSFLRHHILCRVTLRLPAEGYGCRYPGHCSKQGSNHRSPSSPCCRPTGVTASSQLPRTLLTTMYVPGFPSLQGPAVGCGYWVHGKRGGGREALCCCCIGKERLKRDLKLEAENSAGLRLLIGLYSQVVAEALVRSGGEEPTQIEAGGGGGR